jgi:hypothetical protein
MLKPLLCTREQTLCPVLAFGLTQYQLIHTLVRSQTVCTAEVKRPKEDRCIYFKRSGTLDRRAQSRRSFAISLYRFVT